MPRGRGHRYDHQITLHVLQPLIVQQNLEAACGIDLHNHLRQGIMASEEPIGTTDHIFCLFTTIFGMYTVDAFMFYYIANTQIQPESLKKYIEAAALAFMTNRYEGLDDLPVEGRRLRKRGADALLGVENADEPLLAVHSLISRTEWNRRLKGWSGVKESAKEHGAHARCHVEKCGKECYFVCEVCSVKRGKAFGVCGPRTGRSCAQLPTSCI